MLRFATRGRRSSPSRHPFRKQALRFALVGDFVVLSLLLAGLATLREPTPVQPLLPAQIDIGASNQRRLDGVRLEMNALAGASESRVGIALMTTDHGLVLGRQPDSPFVLASVAKIYILTAYLDQLAREERKITESDMELAQAMIEFSDNRSASVLWKRIGGAPGLASSGVMPRPSCAGTPRKLNAVSYTHLTLPTN